MTSLSVRSLTVRLGDNEVLRDVNLQVDSGSSLAILGASGVGKTTLLRAIVGLDPVARGQVLLGWDDITHSATHERGIALVTQQPTLEPRATLATNVERPLKFRGDAPEHHRRRKAVRELFRFGVGTKADRKASETSAGEQQSAATARGTIRNPGLLLLDEPVIALDPDARRRMIRQLRLRHRSEGTTMITATNDWEVAAGLADEIAVLLDGHIAQIGSATDLYDKPSSIEVAELTGRWRLNRLSGLIRQSPGIQTEIITPAGPIRTWQQLEQVEHRQILVGLRPSDLIVDETGDLEGVVVSSVVIGRESLLDIDADGIPVQCLAPTPAPGNGSRVRLSWRQAHLFALEGGSVGHLQSS